MSKSIIAVHKRHLSPRSTKDSIQLKAYDKVATIEQLLVFRIPKIAHITLDMYPYSVLVKVIDFAYNADVGKVSFPEISALYEIAEKCDILSLRGQVILKFQELLNEDNAPLALSTVIGTDNVLKTICKNFVREHYKTISEKIENSSHLREMGSWTTLQEVEKVEDIALQELEAYTTSVYKSGVFSDIVIISNDGKKYNLHKCILRINPYFDKMFSNFSEGELDEIKMDYSQDVLDILFEYFYCCQTTIHSSMNLNTVLSIFEIWDMLLLDSEGESGQLNSLKSIIFSIIKVEKNYENIFNCLKFFPGEDDPMYEAMVARIAEIITPETTLKIYRICLQKEIRKLIPKCEEMIKEVSFDSLKMDYIHLLSSLLTEVRN